MRKVDDWVAIPISRNIKRIKFFLFSFVVFGTLGQFSFPQQLDERSCDSVSGSSLLNSQFLDETIQQKYVSSEDEDMDGSLSKRLGGLFSVHIPGHSSLPIINLNYETYVNSINSFHYILTCGVSPLRSPPFFS
jgi:hypothetical protein